MKVGAPVKVRFKLLDPDKLDSPEELEAVPAQDDAARVAWNGLTTGYQRSLLHYITGAKNIDTRIKRSLEFLGRAKAGLLYGQRKRKNNRQYSGTVNGDRRSTGNCIGKDLWCCTGRFHITSFHMPHANTRKIQSCFDCNGNWLTAASITRQEGF